MSLLTHYQHCQGMDSGMRVKNGSFSLCISLVIAITYSQVVIELCFTVGYELGVLVHGR